MKTKIMKKVIAILCAATMSVSVVAPTGAVRTTQQLSQTDSDKLNNLNAAIKGLLSALKAMEDNVSNWPKDIPWSSNKILIAKHKISSARENLTKLDELYVPSEKLIDIYNSLCEFNIPFFQLSESIKNFNDQSFDDISSKLTDIDNKISKIYEETKNTNNTIPMNCFGMNGMMPMGMNSMMPMMPMGMNNIMPMMPMGMNNIMPMMPMGMNNIMPMMPMGMNNIMPMMPMGMNNTMPMMNLGMNNNNNNDNNIEDNLLSDTGKNNKECLLNSLKNENYIMNFNNTSLSPENQKHMNLTSVNDILNFVRINDCNPHNPNTSLNDFLNQYAYVIFQYGSDHWLNEANLEIDNLLKEARNSMPRHNISALENKFTPIHSGVQSNMNCWMYSSQSIINFHKVTKFNQNPIVNDGTKDNNKRDKVEQEFIKLGGNESVLQKGALSWQHSGEYLEKAKIPYFGFKFSIPVKAHNIKQYEDLNTKIAEWLLLKHFANSDAPIMVDVGNHAVAIAGVSLSENKILILNPITDCPWTRDLNYTCKQIGNAKADFNVTEENKHNINQGIGMFFPSFELKGNTFFGNGSNEYSWYDFKSKALPAATAK